MPNISNIIAVLPGCGEWNPGSKPPHFACESLAKGGWAGWARTYLTPTIEWFAQAGIRPRVLIYLPFSAQEFASDFNGQTIQGPAFNAVQYPGALTTRFVKVLKQFTADADIIAYMGNIKVMPEKSGLPFLDRYMASIRPLIDAGVGYILDEGADYGPTSREFLTAEMTRTLVPFVGYEGWPLVMCENLHDKPVFIIEDVWRKSPQFKERAPLSFLTGEVIRFRDEDEYDGAGQVSDVAQRVVDWTRGVLASGMTAAIPINDLLTAGVKAGELVAA